MRDGWLRYARVEQDVERELLGGYRPHRSRIEDRAHSAQPPSSAWWQSYLRGARTRFDGIAGTVSVVDAFSGVGGLSIGVREAANALSREVRFEAAIDVDAGALEVFSRNLKPVSTIERSVSELVDYRVRGEGDEARFAYAPELLDRRVLDKVGAVDLLVAGPPCQGHSNLNNRTRREDPRNRLYLTAIALGVALRARAIVVENVPEVAKDRSRVVETAQALLRGSGFTRVETVQIDAGRLGAAQSRRRLFLIASRGKAGATAPTGQSIVEALGTEPSSLEWAIGDLANSEGSTEFDTAPSSSEENRKRIEYLFANDLYDLPNSERPACHRDGTTYPAVYGRLRWDRPSPTITTGFQTPGRGRYIHPLRPRVLTPHEAARIQAFPDWFVFAPEGGPAPTRNSLSKWIGDAVPPMMGFAAGLSALVGLGMEAGE